LILQTGAHFLQQLGKRLLFTFVQAMEAPGDRLMVERLRLLAECCPGSGERYPLGPPIFRVGHALHQAGGFQAINDPRDRAFYAKEFRADIGKPATFQRVEPLKHSKFQWVERSDGECTAITIVEQDINFMKELMLNVGGTCGLVCHNSKSLLYATVLLAIEV
jgi:hypothetical protein